MTTDTPKQIIIVVRPVHGFERRATKVDEEAHLCDNMVYPGY
jgi:hypothetical protein